MHRRSTLEKWNTFKTISTQCFLLPVDVLLLLVALAAAPISRHVVQRVRKREREPWDEPWSRSPLV